MDPISSQHVTKLRISSHNLAIEKDRNQKSLLRKRTRQFCTNNKVENEFHFAMDCTLYTDERNELFRKLSLDTNCSNKTDIFQSLFKCNNPSYNLIFSDYISKLFKKRMIASSKAI